MLSQKMSSRVPVLPARQCVRTVKPRRMRARPVRLTRAASCIVGQGYERKRSLASAASILIRRAESQVPESLSSARHCSKRAGCACARRNAYCHARPNKRLWCPTSPIVLGCAPGAAPGRCRSRPAAIILTHADPYGLSMRLLSSRIRCLPYVIDQPCPETLAEGAAYAASQGSGTRYSDPKRMKHR